MLICPNCQSSFEPSAANSGLCPKCNQVLEPAAGQQTAATLEFVPVAQSPGGGAPAAGGVDRSQVTQEMTVDKKHSVRIAARKLSMNDMAMVTSAWGPALGDQPNSRTTFKFDSKASNGRGSSLVVNPRGVRTVHPSKPVPQNVPGADYELLEVIGTGGMGVVYSARQASVDRMVAVKMIKQNVAGDISQREKFLSEAVVTGDLDHPNIVPIYELGTNEDDALFYSMKRVQGTPWSKVIEQKTLDQNLEILMKVADAIAFAHANGVIHRDIKPENVMLGDFGEVLVMDWGLALATASFRHGDFVTTPDSMGGTPAYLAPEMATGPFELIGEPSDIYLLGALLFEIITGVPPHSGKTTQECILAAARNEIQPTDESGELIDIAYRAMATDPADRYATVQDFQAALRDYHAHCESILLATRADQEFEQAERTGDYQHYAQALFGFKEALVLWEGNDRARDGIFEVRLAYAQRAKDKGDYELGLSLLDPDEPGHARLRTDLEIAQHDLRARQKWLSRFKRIAAAMVLIVFGVITASLIVIADAKNQETAAKEQAIQDKIAAEKAEQAAQLAREKEKEQKEKAIAAENKAKQEEALARAAESKAKTAEEEERKQKLIAIEAEKKAVEEEKKALAAKQGEEYAAYVARIGMTAAKIDENAFDTAESLLAACEPKGGENDLRNWEWGYLKRLCRQGVNFDATGTVASVAFSPDRQWFVTAGDDGKATIRDVKTGRVLRAIEQPSPIHAVAVSPDSRLVATAGGDGLVRVARAADGAIIQSLTGHQDRVLDVAFSPRDGRWLLSASRDKSARVWDTTTGHETSGSPLRGHTWWVWSAAFSPDEKQIVTAGQDGKVIVWSFDAREGEPKIALRKVFLGHDGPVFAAAFSPDSRLVASGGYDKRLLVWQPEKIQDVDLKQLVANRPLVAQESRAFEGHGAPIRDVAFSPDGAYLLSGGDDNTLRIWDVMTGKPRTVLRGHSRPVESCAFSIDGKQVLSSGQQGQIKLWSLVDYKELRAPQGRVLDGHDDAILSAAFSRDGKQIVTASRDHTARIYDAATGQVQRVLKEGHEFLVSRALYFNGGRWLLTAASDNSVRVWDAGSGSQLAVMEGTGRNAVAAVSRDSKWILTGKAVKLAAANGQSAEVRGVDFSQPQIALWDLSDDGKSAKPHAFADAEFGTGHRAAVTALAISPDGRWLYSGDETGAGKLWNAASGEVAATLKGHTSRINQAYFLPDSTTLLTSSNDGTVAQWDVATGRELPQKISHSDRGSQATEATPVSAMDLSPDGRQVLTLSENTQGVSRQSVVRLWNVADGRQVFELYRGPEDMTSVAFAGPGGALTVSSRRQANAQGATTTSSFVRRWNLDTRQEVTQAGGPYLDLAGRQEVAWSALEAPAGDGILTVGGNGAVLWNPLAPDKPELVFKPHSGVTAAGFSRDGSSIVTASSDHRAKIWNAKTGLAEFQLPTEHARQINTAGFSPADPALLVTVSNDGTARIWNVTARSVLQVLDHRAPESPVRPVRGAVFSPDGASVATACEDGLVRFWDAASGKLTASVKLETPALAVAYSADGARVIAGGENGVAIVFDVATGEPLVRYLGHTAAIRSVALSPDGRRALTGSNDRTAKLWDTDVQPAAGDQGAETVKTAAASVLDGKEILTLKHHDQAVTAVAFSPDGRTILTAGLDGTAMLWLTDAW